MVAKRKRMGAAERKRVVQSLPVRPLKADQAKNVKGAVRLLLPAVQK